MAQRCLITGGNTGIGYEVARQLLQRGHEVLIACRDSSRAQQAVTRLQQATGSGAIACVQCDLSSFASVRACAEHVTKTWPKLDVLVCNAAVITQQPSLTQDGFDTMYQVNHLSHFLLAHLLLPALLKSDAGRLVVVGSQKYASVSDQQADPLFFHKLHGQPPSQPPLPPQQPQQQQQQQQGVQASPMQLYNMTKLYNMWFMKHMASAVLPELGGDCKLVVNAVSPGFVPTTDLSRHLGGPLGRLVMKYVIAWAPFAVTAQEGGGRVAALCDGQQEGSSSGAFYSKRSVAAVVGPAGDADKAALLWQHSCKDTGVQQYLPQVAQ